MYELGRLGCRTDAAIRKDTLLPHLCESRIAASLSKSELRPNLAGDSMRSLPRDVRSSPFQPLPFVKCFNSSAHHLRTTTDAPILQKSNITIFLGVTCFPIGGLVGYTVSAVSEIETGNAIFYGMLCFVLIYILLAFSYFFVYYPERVHFLLFGLAIDVKGISSTFRGVIKEAWLLIKHIQGMTKADIERHRK